MGPPNRKAEPLSVPLVVRFRQSEVERLRETADERGVSLSQVVRERALKPWKRDRS